MEENNKKKELNYYRLRLRHYLKDYHPQLLGDEAFISSRAEAASEACERAFLTGSNPYEAHYESVQVLLEGLEFSPYLLIEDLIEEMGVSEEMLPTLALRLITSPKVQSILAEYSFSDEFELTTEYEDVRERIRDTIQQTV